MNKKKEFFEDLSIALESWINISSEAISNKNANLNWTDNENSFIRLQEALSGNMALENEDLRRVFSECLMGLVVSFLSILDGGSKLAESSRIYLTDEFGNRLGEGLHDEFISYLIETGRLE